MTGSPTAPCVQSDGEPTRKNALKEAAVQGGALSEVAPVLIEAATDTLDGAASNRCGDGRVVLHER